MAWPKKGTRKIVVEGEEYLWHYDACCPLCSDDVITVGQATKPYVLFIDPFPHGVEIRPKFIATAIQWALSESWSPESGQTKALSFDSSTETFFWLENNERHAQCK